MDKLADAIKIFRIRIAGVSYGVFWFVWAKYGFWWGVLYGLCWPVWVGYRLAEYLLN